MCSQGRSQDLAGGGGRPKNDIFQIWKYACREAMRFARGVRGHVPPIIFFLMVQFGAVLYEKIYILDTRLLWGNSHEEIFENIL